MSWWLIVVADGYAASWADTDLEPELGAEIDDEAQALFAQL